MQPFLSRSRTLPPQVVRRTQQQQRRRNHHHVVPLIINNSDVYGEKFPVTSPLTNLPIWSATAATHQHVEDAVASAQAAFPAWSATKPNERRDIFLKAADVMQRRKDELVGYIHQEIGAGADMQNFIFDLSVEGLKDTAGRIAGATTGTAPHSTFEGMRALVEKVPYGVVLGIGPWYVWQSLLISSFLFCSFLTARSQERPLPPRPPIHHFSARRGQHGDFQGPRSGSAVCLGDCRCLPRSRTSGWLSQFDHS